VTIQTTVHGLARIALDMRDAQKKYFKTRSAADLRLAFTREAELDAAIASVLSEPGLFDDQKETA